MIAIAISLFNQKITDGLLEGCLRALNEQGYENGQIEIHSVPGAFELPAKTKSLATISKYQAIITLGCIIKGETDHYHYISDAVSNGIMNLSTYSKIPIIFGVLTCQNIDYAKKRSSKDLSKNKGYEVGKATIEMIKVFNENNLS